MASKAVFLTLRTNLKDDDILRRFTDRAPVFRHFVGLVHDDVMLFDQLLPFPQYLRLRRVRRRRWDARPFS